MMTPAAITAATMIAAPVIRVRRGVSCLLLRCLIGWLLLRSGRGRGASRAPSRRMSCVYLLRMGSPPDTLAGRHQGRHQIKLHASQDLRRPVRVPAELVHPECEARPQQYLNGDDPGTENPVDR